MLLIRVIDPLDSKLSEFNDFLNPFHETTLFLYHLKISADVFRGYRKIWANAMTVRGSFKREKSWPVLDINQKHLEL